MSRIQVRSFREPDETLTPPLGTSAIVRIGELTVERGELQPGWSWRQHVKPIVRTEWCRFHHRGVVLSGQLGIRMDDGEEAIIGPDSVFDVPPGHDGWVVGDEPLVTIDWAGVEGWASPPGEGERMLATLLFTDIVDSTTLARRLGDAAWTRSRGLHDETVRLVLSRFRGREVETAGDSFLAVFDGAARAVRCGAALVVATAAIDLAIRVGIHSGDVEIGGTGGVRGLAVNTAARVLALASSGEVLVSSTTRDLAEGSSLRFASRGRHELKGLEGERELFLLTEM
jgi:class 3 adenylate cyclase